MMDAGRHPRITLHMQAEVTALDGRPGRFRARLRTAPRYVDPELCVGCGLCAEACPAKVRIFGDLSSPSSQVYRTVHQLEKAVWVMRPEAGTKPNIFYTKG